MFLFGRSQGLMGQKKRFAMHARQSHFLQNGSAIGMMHASPLVFVLVLFPHLQTTFFKVLPQVTDAFVTRVATNGKHLNNGTRTQHHTPGPGPAGPVESNGGKKDTWFPTSVWSGQRFQGWQPTPLGGN